MVSSLTSTLKMETTGLSVASFKFKYITRCYNPEDWNYRYLRRYNLFILSLEYRK
jgi:hypothetical protein